MDQFLTEHYPAAPYDTIVPIHDLSKYCESLREKFAA